MGDAPDIEELLLKHTKTQKEIDLLDTYSELFSLFKTTEKLERAYIRDKVNPQQYEEACMRLIAQFKTQHDAVRSTMPDLSNFMETYSLSCPRAVNRLVRSGMPATLEHGQLQSEDNSTRQAARDVNSCTEQLIGLMDALKLQVTAVDDLVPIVNSTVLALNKIQQLVPDLPGRTKLVEWSRTMHQMHAADNLDQKQVRQLLLDTGSLYEDFRSKI